jgi:hypothetical protein
MPATPTDQHRLQYSWSLHADHGRRQSQNTHGGVLCVHRRLRERSEMPWADTLNLCLAVTLVSAAIILSFTIMEFFDYRRIGIDTSVVVDRSRGEMLTVHLNVTFPRVPCYRETPLSPSPPQYTN